MRMLFIAAGSPATVFALTPLATAAHNAGHEVVMAAPEGVVPVAVNSGFPAVSLTSVPIPEFITKDRRGNPVSRPTDPVEEKLFTGRWFGRLAAACLGPLYELTEDWKPDVVVGGTLCYSAALLAAHLRVPYVRHAWDAKEATGIDPGADEELQPELRELGLRRVPEPDLFVDICPPSLMPPDAGPVQQLRWIPTNRQRRLEPWMHTKGGKRRVCVTAGSRVTRKLNYDFLLDLSRKVSALDVELVIAAPEEAAKGLRDELGPGVICDWVPLDVLAPTCDLIVHHSGGTTSLTAMYHGVPQVSIPENAAHVPATERLADYGATAMLIPGEDTPENVASSCQEVLGNSLYRQRALELSEEMSTMPLPHDVVGRLEDL